MDGCRSTCSAVIATLKFLFNVIGKVLTRTKHGSPHQQVCDAKGEAVLNVQLPIHQEAHAAAATAQTTDGRQVATAASRWGSAGRHRGQSPQVLYALQCR
jgi:hypothetical protein